MSKQTADDLAGLTEKECCAGCKAGHCVISGTWVCSHPRKTALQSALMGKPDVLKRYERAKAKLDHQKISKRTASA